MAGVTKEEIARAKELDLLTYFKLVEPGNLKLVGKEYRHKVHSSLTISKNSLWCWHCIGLRGRTALKYLIDVEKVPYVEAVREINRLQGGVVHSFQPVSLPQPRAEPEAPRDFKLPKPDTNSYAAMAYLRGRCIHPNVLAFCRREGILYQTTFKNHPNCVFVGRDGEGIAKGGSLRGCTQLQFRRDIPGSKKIYPFYIQASTKADTVEVYNAPQMDDGSVITDEEINLALAAGSNFENSKFRIYQQFTTTQGDHAAFLKKEYGSGGRSWDYQSGAHGWVDHGPAGLKLILTNEEGRFERRLPWRAAAKRIAYLIEMQRFLTPRELEQYPAWVAEQREVASVVRDEPGTIPDTRPICTEGSVVYLEDDHRFTVERIGQFDVHLRDEEVPLVGRAISREEFQRQLDANPRNGGMMLSNQQHEALQ